MKIILIKQQYYRLRNAFTAKVIVVFSLLVLLSACNEYEQKASFSRIIDRGYISVGTLYGPTTYYVDKDSYSGFEYELMKKYADSINVELRVVPSYSLDELFTKA